MIRMVDGSIFHSKCAVLVNPINCTKAMGAGLALAFRNYFPGLYEEHVRLANVGFIRPGGLTVFQGQEGPVVVGVPTKRHWRDPSRLGDVILGLRALRSFLEANDDLKSVAIPALGCGKGGLDWGVVYPVILRELDGMSLLIELYPPKQATNEP